MLIHLIKETATKSIATMTEMVAIIAKLAVQVGAGLKLDHKGELFHSIANTIISTQIISRLTWVSLRL